MQVCVLRVRASTTAGGAMCVQPCHSSAAMPLLQTHCCRSHKQQHTGPTLDVPHTVTPQQLEVLLNGLLHNEEKQPYSFYIDGQVSCCGVVLLVLVVWAAAVHDDVLASSSFSSGASLAHTLCPTFACLCSNTGAGQRAGRPPGQECRIGGAVAARGLHATGECWVSKLADVCACAGTTDVVSRPAAAAPRWMQLQPTNQPL
jgi:hypothetical protein